MRKENKESENREKELKERQTKRAEQMAKVNGPKDIVDETNFKRLGFQIIRTEFATGLYGKFYKAKKRWQRTGHQIDYFGLEVSAHLQRKPSELRHEDIIGGDGSEAKSPHCVRVYEMFRLQNRIYISLEMCSKLSIYTRIKTSDTTTELDTKVWAKQIAEAINTLQLCGIAHRNIRTENGIFDKDTNINATIFWDQENQRVIKKDRVALH